MTVLIKGKYSVSMAAPAQVLPDDRVIASTWATPHIVQNPAIKWILSNYVEADTPNRNNNLWTLEGLQMGQPSIAHSPMNIGHREHHIVGAYVASQLMYPTDGKPAAAAMDSSPGQNAYIETLAAFWRFYYPEEMVAVERAYNEGTLWSSMECVAESVTCASEGACGLTFDYAGPMSNTYCQCMQQGGTIQMNNPHFLAGALVLPPKQPGWAGADVREIAQLIKDNSEVAERTYEAVTATAPHMSEEASVSTTEQLVVQSTRVHPLVMAHRVASRVK